MKTKISPQTIKFLRKAGLPVAGIDTERAFSIGTLLGASPAVMEKRKLGGRRHGHMAHP